MVFCMAQKPWTSSLASSNQHKSNALFPFNTVSYANQFVISISRRFRKLANAKIHLDTKSEKVAKKLQIRIKLANCLKIVVSFE